MSKSKLEYWETCRNKVRLYHPKSSVELGLSMYAVFDGSKMLTHFKSKPEDAWISAYNLVRVNF